MSGEISLVQFSFSVYRDTFYMLLCSKFISMLVIVDVDVDCKNILLQFIVSLD